MASTNTEDNGHVTYPRPLIFEGPCPKPEDVRFSVEVDEATVQAVERQTRGQRLNSDWFIWRKNRITASIAYDISHSRFANEATNTPPKSYVKIILGKGSSKKTEGMKWGINQEAKAVQKYQELKSTQGRPVQVKLCGLFIDPLHVWLGATPDRIVEDEQTGELLCLEVICPYKHRGNTMREAFQDKDFCLELGDKGQEYRLKTNHKYYTQVQCQMAVTGIHMADLAVFTLRETVYVPVTFDLEFWNDTVAKLETFYRGILPCLPPHIHNAGAISEPKH